MLTELKIEIRSADDGFTYAYCLDGRIAGIKTVLLARPLAKRAFLDLVQVIMRTVLAELGVDVASYQETAEHELN